MPHFYGIYLRNEAIATVLDLIRFVGEPDAIRLSHITLRGPYKSKISQKTLSEDNEDGALGMDDYLDWAKDFIFQINNAPSLSRWI